MDVRAFVLEYSQKRERSGESAVFLAHACSSDALSSPDLTLYAFYSAFRIPPVRVCTLFTRRAATHLPSTQ